MVRIHDMSIVYSIPDLIRVHLKWLDLIFWQPIPVYKFSKSSCIPYEKKILANMQASCFLEGFHKAVQTYLVHCSVKLDEQEMRALLKMDLNYRHHHRSPSHHLGHQTNCSTSCCFRFLQTLHHRPANDATVSLVKDMHADLSLEQQLPEIYVFLRTCWWVLFKLYHQSITIQRGSQWGNNQTPIKNHTDWNPYPIVPLGKSCVLRHVLFHCPRLHVTLLHKVQWQVSHNENPFSTSVNNCKAHQQPRTITCEWRVIHLLEVGYES